MTEDIIKKFVTGFAEYHEHLQLEKAKETKGWLKQLNKPTLAWLRDTCQELLNDEEEKL